MKSKKDSTTPLSPPIAKGVDGVGGDVQQDKGGTEALQSEIQSLNENWKRALADYQNLMKRVENDKKEVTRYTSMALISKLIPTLDILEMAAKHSEDPGVKMAVSQFQNVLKDEGLQEINPEIGEEFNAFNHEAIEVLVGEADNTVAEVLTKGYKIGDYVIRPAKVKVFKLALDN